MIEFDKRYIEKLYRQMKKCNSDVVVSDYVKYDGAKQQYNFHTNGNYKETTYSVIEWFDNSNQLRSISESWFESIFGRLFKIKNDDKLWFKMGDTARNNSVAYRAYLSGNKITFLNEPLYIIDKQASLEEHEKAMTVDIMEEIITLLKIAHIDTIEEERQYSKSLLFYMDHALECGDIWKFKYFKHKLIAIKSIQRKQEKTLE